jgi:lysophospholipase L1-like esterase
MRKTRITTKLAVLVLAIIILTAFTPRAGDSVALASDESTKTISCIFIGDSTTAHGIVTKDILNLQESSWLNVKLLGSRGTSPNLHEGRAGWSARNYISSSYAGGAKNSFYNARTKKFDFTYYMKKQKYKQVDYVFINLGINDTFIYKSDKALNAEITKILKRYDQMASSIHKYSKSIKVAVCITIPPTSNAAGFKSIYGTKQTYSRYVRNNRLWVKALKKHFAGKESNKIYLVDINSHIDRSQIVGVHPNATGYSQIASFIWSWLQDQES